MAPLPWAPSKPATTGNEYFATFNLYLPLNRRLELLVVAPFIASNPTSSTGHYVSNFGDLTISERFRLVDQRDFSMQALLTERTPTGQTVNGNDINYITPALEFWCNFAPKWVLRGGTGINIDTGRTSATSTYFTNLAMGRYLTTKDAAHLQVPGRPHRGLDPLGRPGPEGLHHRRLHLAGHPVRPGPGPEVERARRHPGARHRAPSLRLAAQFRPGAHLLTGLSAIESACLVPLQLRSTCQNWRSDGKTSARKPRWP